MFSLILVTISIALLASFVMASVNYVPVDAYLLQQTSTDAQKNLMSVDGTVRRYLNSQRNVGTGVIAYPGDGVDLVPLMTPTYGFMPSTFRELGFTVVTGQYSGQQAVAICLYPTATLNSTQKNAMTNLQLRLPTNSAFYNSVCGATTNDLANGTRLTYWILLNQVSAGA